MSVERVRSALPARAQAVFSLLDSAIQRASAYPELSGLYQELRDLKHRLEQPMRVAVVGKVKVGKSTFVNALLGEALVGTGRVEKTFNINDLVYGETPSVLVHFKDERPPETKTIAELEAATGRGEADPEYLHSIKYIEVFYPNPILRTFHLIDTPGMASFYEQDSQNTRDFLLRYGDELTRMTQTEASNADAVLYLFTRSVSVTDERVMEEFQGPVIGQATPINSIGILNKVEEFWGSVEDPMEAGGQVARRLAEHPQVRSLFYGVYPICGLLAFGARTFMEEEYEILLRLSRMPRDSFARLTRAATRFVTMDGPDVSVSSDERQRVLARFGLFGVWMAVNCLQGEGADPAGLREQLLDYSGLPALEKVVHSHFGNRAYLIKLGGALQRIAALAFMQEQRLQGEPRAGVREIAGQFEALASQEHGFAELDVLRSYYHGKLDFTAEEAEQLLQVTGEYGTSALARLGLDGATPLAALLPTAQQRLSYWRTRGNDYFSSGRETISGARVIARSYEQITRQVMRALEVLNLE